jgi:hypothetical protein
VQGNPYQEGGKWQASLGWRYQRSFRHYVGTEEQVNRTNEGSEVINVINLADFSLTYAFSERLNATVGIPYLMATRSSPIRNAQRQVIGRYTNQAHGIGDITLTSHYWLIDPQKKPSGNVQVGFGFKLPTGEDNVLDNRLQIVNGNTVATVQTIDQSIQPGDGGFGFVVDLNAFQQIAGDKAAVYFTGTYLFNPYGTNGVYTYRGRPSESIMSVADQFLLRAGGTAAIPGVKGLVGSLGVRMEEVPVHDILGASDGFRRPGYAVSIEPGFGYTWGSETVSVYMPWAIARNRLLSVSDAQDGTHGDAAFADWLLLFGFSHRF